MLTREQGARLSGLDGLRAVAVLAVTFCHLSYQPQFPHNPLLHQLAFRGATGVIVFFVLSGFLITTLLLKEERLNGRIDVRNFYLRRFLRILPPAILFLLTMLALELCGVFPFDGQDLLRALTFARNFGGYGMRETSHFWSLAVEEQFYLVWPMLLIVLPRNKRIFTLLVLAMLAPMWRWMALTPPAQLNDIDICRIETGYFSLLAGGLFALLNGHPKFGRWLVHPLLQTRTALAAGFLLLLASLLTATTQIGAALLPTIAVLGIIICINYLIRGHQSWIDRRMNGPALTWIGSVSYDMYLWQQLFCFGDSRAHWFKVFPLNILLTVAATAASWYILERPIARLRERFQPRRVPEPLPISKARASAAAA